MTTCRCCGRLFPDSQIHDLKVKRPISRECLARLRAMPNVRRQKPLTAIPSPFFRMMRV